MLQTRFYRANLVSYQQVNNRPFQQSLSFSSSCVSASEFFDAEEHDSDPKPTEIIAADEVYRSFLPND